MSGLWAEELIELRKKVELLEQGLDLCVRAFKEWGHIHDPWETRERQFAEPMQKALQHPAVQEAEKRLRAEYWRRMKKVAKEVESWPEWKKGGRVSR